MTSIHSYNKRVGSFITVYIMDNVSTVKHLHHLTKSGYSPCRSHFQFHTYNAIYLQIRTYYFKQNIVASHLDLCKESSAFFRACHHLFSLPFILISFTFISTLSPPTWKKLRTFRDCMQTSVSMLWFRSLVWSKVRSMLQFPFLHTLSWIIYGLAVLLSGCPYIDLCSLVYQILEL